MLVNRTHIEQMYQEGKLRASGTLQGLISTPILFNGFKVDIRIFGVVTSLEPLRFYISRSGFFRSTFPSSKFNESGIFDLDMHITNEGYNGRVCTKNTHHSEVEQATYGTLSTFRTKILTQNGLDPEVVWHNIRKSLSGVMTSISQKLIESNENTTSFILWADIAIDRSGEVFVLEMDPNTYVFKPDHGCYSDLIVQKEAYRTVLAGTLLANSRVLFGSLNISLQETLRFDDEISKKYLYERVIPVEEMSLGQQNEVPIGIRPF